MSFLRNISNNLLPDAELIARYKETGDLSWLGELYRRYMDLVFGVCLKYYKEPERSKDAVMQIFEELIEKLKKHEVGNFKSWLYQLAKNHCLMQLRTPRNLNVVEMPDSLMQSNEDVHLNGAFEREENFEKLESCMAKLAEKQRTAVKLFYLENRSYKEIADSMTMESGKVRSLIQNGRRNLKICMEGGQGERDQGNEDRRPTFKDA